MNAMTLPDPALRPHTRQIATSLGALAVTEVGAGEESVVLWPSIFTTHAIYEELAANLATRARVILIDGPAHGASEPARSEFSMADCARAMLEIMDGLGIGRAVVGGTSWGGLTGAELALTAPERVQALLLMNTPMLIDERQPGLKARLISMGARWMPASARFANGVSEAFFSPQSLQRRPEFAQRFRDMLAAADPAGLATSIRSVILRGRPLLPRLRDIRVPTLVVAGEDDAMYPLRTQAEAAVLLPEGRFAVVPGRHISVIDAPDDVARAIDDFLRETA